MEKDRNPRVNRRQMRAIGEIFDDGISVAKALRKATREALLLHKRAGVPLPIWRNGRTVFIQPGEIRLPRARTARRSRPASGN
jgi:hypothetical protein